MAGELGWSLRHLLDDADVDDHVVAEVLVAGDEGVALLVLKAHALGARRARVEAVEVLDRRHDGLGGVVRVDGDTHGEARTTLRRLERHELEFDILGVGPAGGADPSRVCSGRGRRRELHLCRPVPRCRQRRQLCRRMCVTIVEVIGSAGGVVVGLLNGGRRADKT